MTHDEAVAIIKGPREPGAEGYLKYSQACSVVYVDHMQATGRGAVFTTDAVRSITTTDGVSSMTPPPRPHPSMPSREYVAAMAERYRWEQAQKRTKDATREPDWHKALDRAQDRTRDQTEALANYSFPTSEQSEMGSAPGGGVGGELVQLLDNNFRYYIGKDDQGRVALFRHVLTEATPIRQTTTADFAAFARRKEARDQAQQRSISRTVKDFWSKQSNG